MRFIMTYLTLVSGAGIIGLWQGDVNVWLGIVMLFQAYLIANDLPKD